MYVKKLAIFLLVLIFIYVNSVAAESELPVFESNDLKFDVNTMTINTSEHIPSNPEHFTQDGLAYHDDSIDIKIFPIRKYDTPILVAFVQIADASQLRTEQARTYPSKATMRISEIAKRVNAIFAVNADWFTYHNAGIVYRNGTLLRNRPDSSYDGLAIDNDGNFHIIRPMTEEEYSKVNKPIMHSFAFGPALVMNGELLEIKDRKITFKQRMAIGQLAPLSYVFVATDGPDQKDSAGLSVPQLAELMHDLGAINAYNLDGGQSTSMLMNYTKLNGQNAKKMRAVGDIIYFTTLVKNK